MGRWVGLMTLVLVAASTTVSFGQPGAGRASSNGVMMADFGAAGADSLKGSKTCLVRVVSVDGKTVTGTLRLTTAVIGSSLGIYEIKPEKVQEIRLDPLPDGDFSSVILGNQGAQKAGQVVTSGGEVIEGVVLLPKWWRVETDLGTLTPNIVTLKSITFLKKNEPIPSPEDELVPIPAPGLSPPPPGPGAIRSAPTIRPPAPKPDEALPPPGSLPTPAPSN